MNVSPRVSIIIPVFNGERFLERCLKSVIEQSYKDIEIIIINDGSTDSTAAICDDLLETDQRIKVVHKKNGGVSAARNVGLNLAVGEYIYFVDADDYVLQDGIKSLVNKADENFSDLVVAEYYVASETNKNKVSPLVLKDVNSFLCSILSGENHSALWNKLFRRKLFDNVRFPEDICYMEDRVLIIEILTSFQPKLEFLKNAVYVYWQDDSSVTNSKGKVILEIFDAHLSVAKYLNKFSVDQSVKNIFSSVAFKSIYFVFRNIDVKYLNDSISIAYSFHHDLLSMGFRPSSEIKIKIFLYLFYLPKIFPFYLIRILRLFFR